MMSFIEIYLVSLGFTRFKVDYDGFHRDLLGFTVFF